MRYTISAAEIMSIAQLSKFMMSSLELVAGECIGDGYEKECDGSKNH
jgi:hypothetical protein